MDHSLLIYLPENSLDLSSAKYNSCYTNTQGYAVWRLTNSAWHDQKTREREERRSGFYFSSLKMQMDPLFGKTRKFYASRFYQLKVGHGAIGTFLHRIEATETAECWWCGDAEQSVINLYTKCRKWRTERRVLKKSLGKAGIQWQRRPGKKWLAKRLADKYAVGSLLDFLKNTEVGSRENAREREMEWEQRRDQDRETQLEDLYSAGYQKSRVA